MSHRSRTRNAAADYPKYHPNCLNFPGWSLSNRTQHVCAHMNNMEHVRRTVSQILEQFRKECQERGVMVPLQRSDSMGGPSVVSMATMMTSEMELRISDVCRRLAEMMRVDLRRHIFHLAWSPETLPAEEAICPLMDYLDDCLISLHGDLMKLNFERALGHIWQTTVLEISDQANSQSGDKTPAFFGRLVSALNILQTFFHAEGRGLSHTEIKTELFNEVHTGLQLHSSSTDDLLQQFHRRRLLLQCTQETQEFGTLSVRAYFHHDSLSVEVLTAKNLIPLDNNGLSDPFVIIELLPRTVFSHCDAQQTVVHKRTLNPVFDECFEYSVSLDQCKSDDAMLLFTVMDYDVLTFNDFEGECYLSLNQISGVDRRSDKTDSFHGLKQIDLNLMQPRDKDDPILRTLEERLLDPTAQALIKKRRERASRVK